MTLEVDLNLSPQTWAYIENEAARREIPPAAIVSEILSEVLEEYYREPTKAEILQSIRDGLQQALRGETRPLDALR